MNLFICGSIKIKDKEWIFSRIEECIAEKNFTNVTILEGEARGVDLIAKEWALAHDIPVKEYPPDVEHYPHKEACHKRNEDMTKDCDFALMLWNGKSYGTFDDIQICEKYSKPYKICYYDLTEYMQKYLSLAMEKFKPKLADGPRELLDDIWEEAMKIRGRYIV